MDFADLESNQIASRFQQTRRFENSRKKKRFLRPMILTNPASLTVIIRPYITSICVQVGKESRPVQTFSYFSIARVRASTLE